MNPSVSIIIPTWKGKALLDEFLPSVIAARNNYPGEAEIIVVDDGSKDGSVQHIEATWPDVKAVGRYENGGYAKTIQTGVDHAAGELLLFLNNDVEVASDFIAPLADHFSDPDVFQVTSLGLLKDKRTVGEGPKSGCFKRSLLKFHRSDLSTRDAFTAKHQEAMPTLFASGGHSLLSRQKFLAMGGYDPLYEPFYWEDVDLSYRAWKRGWRVLIEPRSVVFHGRGGTIDKAFKKKSSDLIKDRNRLLFTWKNMTDPLWLFSRHLLPLALRLLLGWLILDLAFYRAFFAAAGRLSPALQARRAEK
ncbi:glycosyltransferase family 2 protein, partial [Candidatus Hydrogenedentota bacterium]